MVSQALALLSRLRRPVSGLPITAALTLLVPLAAHASVAAQSPRSPTLLVDLDTTSAPILRSSEPAELFVEPSRTWFTARSYETGIESWVTDGTPANTRAIDDRPGGDPASGFGVGVMLPSGTAVAVRTRSGLGPMLHAAAPGATRWSGIMNLSSDPFARAPRSMVVWNGAAWFVADDGTSGIELWRSDGTRAGTRVVEDLPLVPGSQLTTESTVLATPTGLWMVVGDLGRPRQLFHKVAVGTPAVVVQAASGPVSPTHIWGGIGSRGLVFACNDAVTGIEPWITDGTVVGTRPLVDIIPGLGSSSPGRLAAEIGRIWFYARTPSEGYELWMTDGTSAGTRMIVDRNPGAASGILIDEDRAVAAFGGLVYAGNDPVTGGELHFSDGTPAGTGLLRDIDTVSTGSYPESFALLRGRVWFRAYDGLTGYELWSTDGTAGGTRLELDLLPGPESGGVRPVADVPGVGLLVAGNDGRTGEEPWLFDPGTGRALLLGNLMPDAVNGGAGIERIFPHDTFALLLADRGLGGVDFVATRGTPASTIPLPMPTLSRSRFDLSILVSLVGSLPTGLVVRFRQDVSSNRQIWFTDGTPAGSRRIGTMSSVVDSRELLEGVEFEGRLWFHRRDRGAPELWVTDGTVLGTRPAPGFTGGSTFLPILAHRGLMWGCGESAQHGTELWVSDGTAGGTRQVTDVWQGSPGSAPASLTPLGDRVFFTAETPGAGREPWISDGTAAGTVQLADLEPGPVSSQPTEAVSLGDRVVFVAVNSTFGGEPWVTDGTAGGTRLVKELTPGTSRFGPRFLARAGDRVVVGGPDTLWSTDGTAAGTLRFDAANVGATISSRAWPVGDDGSFVFTGSDVVHGRELWASDGTVAGTRIVGDSFPGAGSSFPEVFARFGDGLLFQADDGRTGAELHRIPLADFGAAVASPFGTGCGARLAVEGTPGIGRSFTIRIDAAAPGGASGLVLGSAPAADVLQAGCVIQVAAPSPLANYSTDAQGDARLTVSLPIDPALIGAHLFLQSVHLRVGGPLLGGLELTQGLELLVGD